MIRRIVGLLLLVPFSAALIVFALANRQAVYVNFNPLVPVESVPAEGTGVPLFLVVYAVLLIGVLLGGVSTWFAQSHHRLEKRSLRREAERLSSDLAAARRTPGQPFTDTDILDTP